MWVVVSLQNRFANIVSLTPNGFPWADNGQPMPTAAAAAMLGMLWSAEDAAAEAAVTAAVGRGWTGLLPEPVRERLHCWGLQMVGHTACNLLALQLSF
jgi:hypothetical protein